jgi:hypothetical protein
MIPVACDKPMGGGKRVNKMLLQFMGGGRESLQKKELCTHIPRAPKRRLQQSNVVPLPNTRRVEMGGARLFRMNQVERCARIALPRDGAGAVCSMRQQRTF